MSHAASADSSAPLGTGQSQVRIRDVRSWIASLPLAGSATSAERLYQAIFELNRRDLDPGQRLDLMELYAQPVASVSAALQAPWVYLRLPMAPRARRLAEFLRNLHGEMAGGYQAAIKDLLKAHHTWDRKASVCLAAERAIDQLGEVLLRTYQVYMPIPAGVWREIHGVYRLIEEQGLLDHPVSRSGEEPRGRTTVRSTYLRVLALGLCGPYQLPQNDCLRVNAFLRARADQAALALRPDVAVPAGQFEVDLLSDVPARAIPKGATPAAGPNLRVLSTFVLARSAYEIIERLRGGQFPAASEVGFDCSDSGCLDLLWLMVRFWGAGVCRQYPRRRALESELSLCVGLKSLHFFSSGRKDFSAGRPEDQPAYTASPAPAGDGSGEIFIDLDSGVGFPDAAPEHRTRLPAWDRHESRRWAISDESAGGLALVHRGRDVSVHVGELLGIRSPVDSNWGVGVVRWIKSPESGRVDLGVKLLAPIAAPVAVRSVDGTRQGGYVPALQLAEVPAVGQPRTLLLERGLAPVGKELDLRESADGISSQRVRITKVIRRTSSFEQAAFEPVAVP